MGKRKAKSKVRRERSVENDDIDSLCDSIGSSSIDPLYDTTVSDDDNDQKDNQLKDAIENMVDKNDKVRLQALSVIQDILCNTIMTPTLVKWKLTMVDNFKKLIVANRSCNEMAKIVRVLQFVTIQLGSDHCPCMFESFYQPITKVLHDSATDIEIKCQMLKAVTNLAFIACEYADQVFDVMLHIKRALDDHVILMALGAKSPSSVKTKPVCNSVLLVGLECWSVLATVSDPMILYDVVEMCRNIVMPLVGQQDCNVRYEIMLCMALVIEVIRKSSNFTDHASTMNLIMQEIEKTDSSSNKSVAKNKRSLIKEVKISVIKGINGEDDSFSSSSIKYAKPNHVLIIDNWYTSVHYLFLKKTLQDSTNFYLSKSILIREIFDCGEPIFDMSETCVKQNKYSTKRKNWLYSRIQDFNRHPIPGQWYLCKVKSVWDDPFLRRKQDILSIVSGNMSKISVPPLSCMILRKLKDAPANFASSLNMLENLRLYLEQPINRPVIIQYKCLICKVILDYVTKIQPTVLAKLSVICIALITFHLKNRFGDFCFTIFGSVLQDFMKRDDLQIDENLVVLCIHTFAIILSIETINEQAVVNALNGMHNYYAMYDAVSMQKNERLLTEQIDMRRRAQLQIQAYVDMLINSQNPRTRETFPPVIQCTICKQLDKTKDFMCIRFICSMRKNLLSIIDDMEYIMKGAYEDIPYKDFSGMCEDFILSRTTCVCCIRSMEHIFKSPVYQDDWSYLGAFDCMLMIISIDWVSAYLSDNEVSDANQTRVSKLIADISKRSSFLPGSWDRRMIPAPKAKIQGAVITCMAYVTAFKVRQNNKPYFEALQDQVRKTISKLVNMKFMGDINLEKAIAEALVLYCRHTNDAKILNEIENYLSSISDVVANDKEVNCEENNQSENISDIINYHFNYSEFSEKIFKNVSLGENQDATLKFKNFWDYMFHLVIRNMFNRNKQVLDKEDLVINEYKFDSAFANFLTMIDTNLLSVTIAQKKSLASNEYY